MLSHVLHAAKLMFVHNVMKTLSLIIIHAHVLKHLTYRMVNVYVQREKSPSTTLVFNAI